MTNHYFAVVTAAGTGQRMQTTVPKQYLALGDKSVITYALAPLLAAVEIQKVIVVLATDDTHFTHTEYAQHPKIITITVATGKERSDTVLAGMQALATVAMENDWVLVHDAARPCLHPTDLHKLIHALQDHAVGGILAKRMVDTVKRSDEHERIIETIPRHDLWQAMTPQMFRYGLLLHALERVQREQLKITDDASALEMAGYQPQLIEGRADNIKITYPLDLVLAAYFLNINVSYDSH